MHLLNADVGFSFHQHFVDFHGDSFEGYFVSKSISCVWIFSCLENVLSDDKAESVSKSDDSQKSQGIVKEGFERV